MLSIRLTGSLGLALSIIAMLALSPDGPARAVAAGPVTAGLELRVGPVMRTVAKRPQPMTTRLALRLDRLGDEDPAVLDRVTLRLPYGATLNGRLFPSCDARTLSRNGVEGCPRAARIGAGTAVGRGDTVVQRVTLTIFNGPGGNSLVTHMAGYRPALIQEAVVAPIARHRGGAVQYTLRIPVPKQLQVVAGIPIGVETLDAKIDGTRRVRGVRRGYVEASICPPGAQIPMLGSFEFLDAPRLELRAWARCG